MVTENGRLSLEDVYVSSEGGQSGFMWGAWKDVDGKVTPTLCMMTMTRAIMRLCSSCSESAVLTTNQSKRR
jgi:hypothetical protein